MGCIFPLQREAKLPLAGERFFYGGARGRFPFFRPRRLIRRGYGAQIYDFSAPSRANALPQSAPPRPLQINRPRQTFVCRGYGLAEPFGLSSALVEPFGSPSPPLPPLAGRSWGPHGPRRDWLPRGRNRPDQGGKEFPLMN